MWDSLVVEELYFPKLRILRAGMPAYGKSHWISSEYIKRICFPLCEELGTDADNEYYWQFAYNCKNIEEINLPSSKIFVYNGGNGTAFLGTGCPSLKKLILGPVEKFGISNEMGYGIRDCSSLIHIEFHGLNTTTRNRYWNPVLAYSIDTSTLVEDASLCTNNIEQFLYNFREYYVKGFAPQTLKKYMYLHETVLAYVLGTDDSHYAANWIVPGESNTYLNTLNDELTTRNWGLAT